MDCSQITSRNKGFIIIYESLRNDDNLSSMSAKKSASWFVIIINDVIDAHHQTKFMREKISHKIAES